MTALLAAAQFEISSSERDRLVAWSRESSRQGLLARIVLVCAESGGIYAQPAHYLGVSVMTVSNVKARFAADRLGGLCERRRSGRR